MAIYVCYTRQAIQCAHYGMFVNQASAGAWVLSQFATYANDTFGIPRYQSDELHFDTEKNTSALDN
jgi:hypothetical protein